MLNIILVFLNMEHTASPPRAVQHNRVPLYEMWDDADVQEETPAPAPAPEEAPAEPAAAKPAEAEPPAPETVMGTEPPKLVFKHWIRPKFLQYTYLYDYQHNYYNDVINYLDRRNKGLPVERPRAQTWGERVLRTYLSKGSSIRNQQKDSSLLRHISTGARFHRYHSKSLISRKYSRLGFNTVSI